MFFDKDNFNAIADFVKSNGEKRDGGLIALPCTGSLRSLAEQLMIHDEAGVSTLYALRGKVVLFAKAAGGNAVTYGTDFPSMESLRGPAIFDAMAREIA